MQHTAQGSALGGSHAKIQQPGSDVRFRQLEIGRGILPSDSAAFWRPPGLAGQHDALLAHAKKFSAAEALQIGLVQEVVPAGSHIQRARELAQLIARVSQATAAQAPSVAEAQIPLVVPLS